MVKRRTVGLYFQGSLTVQRLLWQYLLLVRFKMFIYCLEINNFIWHRNCRYHIFTIKIILHIIQNILRTYACSRSREFLQQLHFLFQRDTETITNSWPFYHHSSIYAIKFLRRQEKNKIFDTNLKETQQQKTLLDENCVQGCDGGWYGRNLPTFRRNLNPFSTQ
jgi:hypothetical protein